MAQLFRIIIFTFYHCVLVIVLSVVLIWYSHSKFASQFNSNIVTHQLAIILNMFLFVHLFVQRISLDRVLNEHQPNWTIYLFSWCKLWLDVLCWCAFYGFILFLLFVFEWTKAICYIYRHITHVFMSCGSVCTLDYQQK